MKRSLTQETKTHASTSRKKSKSIQACVIQTLLYIPTSNWILKLYKLSETQNALRTAWCVVFTSAINRVSRLNSTRKFKDTSTSPVQCHRCQVIGIHCSYEETLSPASPPPALPVNSAPTTLAYVNRTPRPELAFPVTMPPTDRLWEFVSKDREPIDWSAPMLAIQNLTRLPPSSSFNPAVINTQLTSSSPREIALANILSEDQIRFLLDMYVVASQSFFPVIQLKILNLNE